MFYKDSQSIYRVRALEHLPWLAHGFGTRHSVAPDAGTLATLHQIHSDICVAAHGRTGLLGDGDALIENTPGHLVAVKTADCIPVLLADEEHRAVAAVHAGWRGTASRIVQKALDAMRAEFGTKPARVHAAIGPGIGKCCYEVGAEVSAQFGESGTACIDLPEINGGQLGGAGVPASQIYVAQLCTRCGDADFHSFRRDKERSGRMLSFIGVKCVLFLLAIAGALSAAQDAREIVRRSVQLMDRNMVAARNYTFLERAETRELDSDAHVKTRKILLYDVTMLEGSPYRRLVGKDDHGLSPEEERIEQKKLADSIAQRQKESKAERAKRIAEWEKKRQREREPIDEIPDGFNFQITGEGRIDGRTAWIIDATPRSDYHARSTLAKLFPKFRGKLWIDKADYQWVKTEAQAIDNISWGLFIARLSKGARLEIQMTRVNEEVWLPKHIEAKASARVALVKKYRIESDTTFSNYRKFQVESRVIPALPQ